VTGTDATDLELLAAIIQCEADSEPYEGKLAVGSVVMNRVASASFPNTIMQVIYQSGQFSPVASGRFAARLAAGANSTCRQAAQEVLNGNITVSCLYFRTNNGTTSGQIIGSHVFY
jgi:spore germination cell wall hydrolase CwlJ-like protein